MDSNVTFKDLLDFVLANKTNKTFHNYDLTGIITLLQDGVANGTLLYNLDNTGKINGMILAQMRESDKVLFVIENLSMSLSTLRKFATIAKQRWPEYKLEWLKHGIHKQHDTKRIYEKLAI